MFALLKHYYHFTKEELGELTPREVFNYISMIRYVSPFSKDVGKTPPIPQTISEKLKEAKQLGLKVPSKVYISAEEGDDA